MSNTPDSTPTPTGIDSSGVDANPIVTPPAASPIAPEAPDDLIEHLKDREGWRTAVYKDSLGFPTAGMGHLLTTAEKALYPVGATVPDDVLNGWARSDSKKAYDAAVTQATSVAVLDQNFVNALTSVNFQLGVGWTLTFKNTWACIKAHQWEQAAQNVEQSAWFKQTPVRVRDFQAALRALGSSSTSHMA